MTDVSARIIQYAETSRGLVNQAGKIALQANEQISNGTFSSAQWAKSAHQLVNAALTAGLELGPQLMSIACLGPSSELEYSDYLAVAPDNQCERALSVAKSFAQVGAPSCVIPDRFIVFDPPILRVYAEKFRVATNWPDLQSGTYQGGVRLTRLKTGTATPDFVEVTFTVDL
jgi:hypothetical protein